MTATTPRQGGDTRLQGAIRLHRVTKTYGQTVALDGVSVSIAAGESVAIMGPSGSGKSTLALCAAGILEPDSGEVWVGPTNLTTLDDRRRTEFRLHNIGLVFQSGHLLGDLSAAENIAIPMMFAGVGRRSAVAEAERWLKPLGLEGLGARRPGQLSGGQAQRVAIARALVQRPAVVIADEPTGALDQATGASVMELMTAMCAQIGSTLIVVTHDHDVAARCRRRIDVVDGHVTDQSMRPVSAAAGPLSGVRS